MSSQAFFWVNIVLGVILLIYFLLAKRRQQKMNRTRGSIFVYNGHNFDAYEVLGLKTSATRSELEIVLVQLQNCSDSDREFKLAAIMALLG